MNELLTHNATFFAKYFDFESRTKRREFNFIQLTYFLVTFIFLMLAIPLLVSKSMVFLFLWTGLFALYIVLSIIPGIAILFRRTRDIGLHPLFSLLAFVPVVSWVYVVYLMVASTDSVFKN